MDRRLRYRYFQIMDGIQTKEMTHHLSILDQFVHRERMAKWLIDEKFIGKMFLGWVRTEFKGLMLECCREIVRRVNGDRGLKPIIAGKDFI